LLDAFPDMRSSEDDLVVAGDRVAVRRTVRGTHRGGFMGIAPTGREASFGGVWLARMRDGKLVEQWVYFDALGLMRQLGAVPAPA
jgi:predicted ester cyclase